MPRGKQTRIPSAGQNRRVPVFGALDAMTGDVTALITERKRSSEFLDFLDHLLDQYADRQRIWLLMDNCSIHHARRVHDYLAAVEDRVRVIWNAAYAPHLNLIERFWGHLKRTVIANHFFQTTAQLEDHLVRQINQLNRDPLHPARIKLTTPGNL